MKVNIKNNKKHLVKLALLALPLMPLATSCSDDFLDAKPVTAISEANAFDTPDRILAQVNGLYSSAKSGVFLGGRYQIYNDIRAEEFLNRTNNGVTGLGVWNFTVGSADDDRVVNFWIQGYLTINRANLFLKGLDDNSSKINPDDLVRYRGEAKFVRALTYLSLVQIYAKPFLSDNGASPGLPLRLLGETSSANNDMPRSTVAQVYAQILKDLNEAEQELPATYATAPLRTMRAHKNTAIALKTRVHLIMGNYSEVRREANKIVSATAPFTSPERVAHALNPSIATTFTTYTTNESILSFPMTANSAPGTQNQLGFYFNSGGGSNFEYSINGTAPGILANAQWQATDARRTSFVGSNTGTTGTEFFLRKFSNVAPFIDWVPILRYSEVLLNLAEAEAELGNNDRAIALLHAVHRRSDDTWTYTGTTKDQLVNAILTERRIELIGEGFRSNDIMRRGQPIFSVGLGSAIPPTDERYIFMVPTIEKQNNNAL
jgi:starch-binding outer membrane protein, SusD/RagB family